MEFKDIPIEFDSIKTEDHLGIVVGTFKKNQNLSVFQKHSFGYN